MPVVGNVIIYNELTIFPNIIPWIIPNITHREYITKNGSLLKRGSIDLSTKTLKSFLNCFLVPLSYKLILLTAIWILFGLYVAMCTEPDAPEPIKSPIYIM